MLKCLIIIIYVLKVVSLLSQGTIVIGVDGTNIFESYDEYSVTERYILWQWGRGLCREEREL